MSKPHKPTQGRNPGDSITGDKIYLECRKTRKWELYQKSKRHKGHRTIAEKDAYAEILTRYTRHPDKP